MPAIRRSAACLFLVLCLPFLLAGCRESGDQWKRIRESGVLRVGVDPTFPPFALDEGGALEGIDVDLARALAAKLGLEVQFTYFGYDGLYDALATDQVDALISALVIAPERTQDVAYSEPYFDAGQVLVAPAGSDIDGIGDLGGRSVAVELGALGHVMALEQQERTGDLDIATYDSTDAALAAVAAGEADAALVDSVGARLYLRDEPRLVRLPNSAGPEPYAVAVRIEDETLLDELNAALAELTASGELAAIIERRLGP